MSDQEIKAGSVVQLKSGGPLMTVQQVADHWGTLTAWCDWFVQDKAPWKKEHDTFPVTSLKLVDS
ncbi:DUF2158 domain-containing protein [Bradyrhizobium sp. 147]|uniref:DUF2158 domain-containing protein n=1 Tax=Bradyrhizobium sp. 147 TaxID=2782623 RepID=UPI001FF8E323|nr:DUF2158 domain-containing protein [Bradyrhizobium sp. 147]MCK1681759.1 DUF2158 domain-containing protein [Bradyrhizobium sp. 147]